MTVHFEEVGWIKKACFNSVFGLDKNKMVEVQGRRVVGGCQFATWTKCCVVWSVCPSGVVGVWWLTSVWPYPRIAAPGVGVSEGWWRAGPSAPSRHRFASAAHCAHYLPPARVSSSPQPHHRQQFCHNSQACYTHHLRGFGTEGCKMAKGVGTVCTRGICKQTRSLFRNSSAVGFQRLTRWQRKMPSLFLPLNF